MLEEMKELLLEFRDEVDDITEESTFVGDVALSSLDFIVFMSNVEEQYDIEISDDDMRTFVTMGDLMKFVKENGK